MVEMEEPREYKVKAWTKDGQEWWWNNATHTEAMEVYETLKAGQIYEDVNEEDTVIEYIDGSHIYQVKVFHRG